MTRYRLKLGDCLEVMKDIPDNSFHSVVCDPPYGLKFMGKAWDHGVPGESFWREMLRVAKPGAHLLAFGGTRTHHRLMVAIEDAGWEIRDCLMWLYGCLSEDTEILIDGQWEPYHKAMAGKHALCYNIDSDTYEWQPIQEVFVYDYADTAYRIQSDFTDQIVSRNHRCIVERGGNFTFQVAEQVARQRQARVPVLEDLPALLEALPLPDQRASAPQQVLRQELSVGLSERTENRQAIESGGYLSALQEGVLASEQFDSRCNLLQPIMPSKGKRRASSASLRQRQGQAKTWHGDGGRKKSGVEGRSNLLPQARQLQANQVRALPSGVYADGAQRRLRDGASFNSGATLGASAIAGGSGASCQPRSAGQSTGESSTLRQQPRSQTVRASRFTRTDLATVTPIFYKGIVWCVRVPSGAFVARRNGRIFVTGNSGFPKSMDVGKAIDKAAGAEREVIGVKPGHEGFANRGNMSSVQSLKGTLGGEGGFARPWMDDPEKVERYHHQTAPATDAARQWDGWGTALKPAWEPIILARKPLGMPEVDIIQAIEYNLRKNGFQGDIRWTQKPARRAEKPKQQASSTPTKQPLEVGIFAEPASASEMPDTETTIEKKLEGQAESLRQQIGKECLNMPSVPVASCEKKSLPHTVENAPAAEKQPTNSSPLTILTAAVDSTENQPAPTSTPNYGGNNSRLVIESSAGTAMPPSEYTVSVLTVIFDGIEYSIQQLPDCSLIWPDGLPKRVPARALTVAANVLEHGAGGLNVDASRIGETGARNNGRKRGTRGIYGEIGATTPVDYGKGRWPANLILDEEAGAMLDQQTGILTSGTGAVKKATSAESQANAYGKENRPYGTPNIEYGDFGGASRFFYCPKASKKDRGEGNTHPTTKPTDLMRYLVRLVTPPNGIVFDPFMGSGSTLKAALLEGFRGYGIEKEQDYFEIAKSRIENILEST